MTDTPRRPLKAYQNEAFLNSRDARPLRILSEYFEPQARFERQQVEDTIVFMGSARTLSRSDAEAAVAEAEKQGEGVEAARYGLAMSAYYEAARELANRLTHWSKNLGDDSRRFVVCTGGGPGIMEAANRGASEARGINVGLTISLPVEQYDNPYLTRGLDVHFHYFFMRKFWFVYLAKAVIVFPGGFGTLDELFEILTLVQTRKLRKELPVVLFGTEYWSELINFDVLVRHGTIDAEDLKLFHRTDSVDDAFDFVTRMLLECSLDKPGPRL